MLYSGEWWGTRSIWFVNAGDWRRKHSAVALHLPQSQSALACSLCAHTRSRQQGLSTRSVRLHLPATTHPFFSFTAPVPYFLPSIYPTTHPSIHTHRASPSHPRSFWNQPGLGLVRIPAQREQGRGEGHQQNPLWLRSRTPSRMGVANSGPPPTHTLLLTLCMRHPSRKLQLWV